MTRLILIVALCVCAVPVEGAPITLARNGKATATIVIPPNPDDKLKIAAAELQKYVQALCGVELPIREDGKRVEGTGLYVGRCEVTTEADFLSQDLNPETYAIRVRDGNVLFTGRWPTPTYFAVASFLEDNLGVRWFAPGDLWEYVPKGQPGELVVEVQDVVKVPDTSPRIWSGHAWFDSWKTWNLRNKTVLSEVIPRRQFQNFLNQVFPPEKYGQEHPEYYPLIGGDRWIPPPGTDSYWRPCESHPEVLRLTVEYARRWFDEHPDVDSFSLGMDDISHLCGCPHCRALDPRPDSYEKGEFSDRHYQFVNAVAREIKKTHPDRYVGTLIYAIARQPPETVPQLEDNVFGFITETSAAWWMPGRKEADHEITREWARRCQHLSRYDYYGFGSFTPRFYPHHVDEQIKFDKSLGLEGMYTEVYTFLPHTAPMIWAFAKLQWDHTLNVDDLLGEFYARMYGPAAPIMKDYFDLLERSYNTPRPGRGAWEHRNLLNQALAMSPEDVDEGFRLLDRAFAVVEGVAPSSASGEGRGGGADDPKVRARIDVVRGGLQYASYVIRAYAISQRLQEMAVTDEQTAAEALTLADRLGTLSEEREKFWAEAPQRDDLLGETLRGLGGMGYLVTGQVADVEQGGLIGAMKSLAWYAQNTPDKLAAVSQRLSTSGRGPIAEMVKAWLWVQEAKPDNLVVNGGFEDGTPNRAEAEMDWRTEGAPQGWSIWSATADTKFETLGGQGQEGSAAASISRGQSACYLQSHPVQAGEKYLCVCWVKADPPELSCGAYLGIRFRDPKGAWHERRDLEPTVSVAEGQPGWQPLVVMVTAPEGAGSLLVMPGARGQAEGGRALFDNVALYRVTLGH